jgi:hypothetical protein
MSIPPDETRWARSYNEIVIQALAPLQQISTGAR